MTDWSKTEKFVKVVKDVKVRLNALVNPKTEKISEIISKKVCVYNFLRYILIKHFRRNS